MAQAVPLNGPVTAIPDEMATVGRTRIWWTAAGFLVGSALFAVGVPLSTLQAVPLSVSQWVFFGGSVFFTTAALLQLLTSRDALEPPESTVRGPTWLATVARPRTLDWTASALQFVGTVAFNLTTLRAAALASGSADPTTAQVWNPDAVGSVLFLVSSGLAFAPEVRWRRHRHARDRSWAIAALNLMGSLFFGASAVGAHTLPSTGELVSVRWANLGTFLGALCFLVGSYLLLPRGGHRTTPAAGAAAAPRDDRG